MCPALSVLNLHLYFLTCQWCHTKLLATICIYITPNFAYTSLPIFTGRELDMICKKLKLIYFEPNRINVLNQKSNRENLYWRALFFFFSYTIQWSCLTYWFDTAKFFRFLNSSFYGYLPWNPNYPYSFYNRLGLVKPLCYSKTVSFVVAS